MDFDQYVVARRGRSSSTPSSWAAPRPRQARTSTRCCTSSASGSGAPRTPTRWCARRSNARSAGPPRGPAHRPRWSRSAWWTVAVAVGARGGLPAGAGLDAVAVRAHRRPGRAAPRAPGLRRLDRAGAVLRTAGGWWSTRTRPVGRRCARAPRSRSRTSCRRAATASPRYCARRSAVPGRRLLHRPAWRPVHTAQLRLDVPDGGYYPSGAPARRRGAARDSRRVARVPMAVDGPGRPRAAARRGHVHLHADSCAPSPSRRTGRAAARLLRGRARRSPTTARLVAVNLILVRPVIGVRDGELPWRAS